MRLQAQTVSPAEPDARRARRDLRAQIARLEARGVTTPAAASGPRLLSLGELEALRDAMLARTAELPVHDVASPTFEARRALEAMLADPAAHRGQTIALAALGRPGCGVYAVRPRLGLLGCLMNWWRVTLSSGCP